MLRFFEKQPSCLVGIEACGSSHYWAREIAARCHDVRLIPQLPGPSDRIAGLLAAAQRYHQAGELAEAERGYRKILAADRKHIGSIDLLGIVANNLGNVQQGKLDDAVVQYDPGIARLTE